ncbi:hypothetical protein HK104_005862 [Borealophlyctis nickersoniae]|nr:hypothetical protein HK104_005862 [Borealophlyctis nickersoniae]
MDILRRFHITPYLLNADLALLSEDAAYFATHFWQLGADPQIVAKRVRELENALKHYDPDLDGADGHGISEPWLIYTSLVHDVSTIPYIPPCLFTKLMQHTFEVVGSPQTCVDRLAAIIRDMIHGGVPPRQEDWDILMDAYNRWGRLDNFGFIIEEGERWEGRGTLVAHRAQFYAGVLKRYGFKGSLFSAMSLADYMMDRFRPEPDWCADVLEAFVFLRKPQQVWDRYTAMVANGLEMDARILIAVLRGLSMARTDTFDTRVNLSDNLTAVPIVKLALTVLDLALSRNIIDQTIFSLTIHICLRRRDWNQAQKIHAEMREIHQLPTTLDIYLGFAEFELNDNNMPDRDAAAEYIERMLADRNAVPDPFSVKVHQRIIEMYMKIREVDLAYKHWKNMREQGIQPDAWMYNTLLHHMMGSEWVELHRDRVHEVHEAMKADGLELWRGVWKSMEGMLALRQGELSSLRLAANVGVWRGGPGQPVVDCYSAVMEDC